MNRILALLLILFLLLSLLGCSAPKADVDCQEVAEHYESLGYEVFHSDDDIYDWQCYIRVTDSKTAEDIWFHFFDSEDQAKSYAENRQYNVLVWLFTVIYGDPTWVTTVTYNNIEIEYDSRALFLPFLTLINS